MAKKDLEKKVTKIILVADGHHGHYGYAFCGHCEVVVQEPYSERKKCLNCGYEFKGFEYGTPNIGGSDF